MPRGYTDDAIALCHAMVGLPGPECEAMLLDRYGEDFPLADINRAFLVNRDEVHRRPACRSSRARSNCSMRSQAAECPMAIVTSSSRRTAERHLALAGIRSRFDTILTRDDVTRGKPSPDLVSARRVPPWPAPEACVAVEDSNHGVTAAHAAGAITIMVPDMVPPTDESPREMRGRAA